MSYQPSAINLPRRPLRRIEVRVKAGHQPFSRKAGFTLIELILVMVIIAILTTFITGGIGSSQIKGRDAQRKSDLKQLASALELFYQDFGQYPPENNGVISACPYSAGTGSGTDCSWGTGRFTDDSSLYLKRVPADPDAGKYYRYRLVPGSNSQKFQLFARLENPNDKGCIDVGAGPNCTNPVAYICGAMAICNFSITSSNTEAIE
ncbi:prepilin-type N-terminal cleavage/methylation domain-containing protein [Patescibacteria group bacterium]|nr:prepilin-type N-terminal cleavage/methylation domain-containing protein [Patescibacteria group bacterium]